MADLNVQRQLTQRARLIRTHNATSVMQQINQFRMIQLQITSTLITQRTALNDRMWCNIDQQIDIVILSLKIRLLMS